MTSFAIYNIEYQDLVFETDGTIHDMMLYTIADMPSAVLLYCSVGLQQLFGASSCAPSACAFKLIGAWIVLRTLCLRLHSRGYIPSVRSNLSLTLSPTGQRFALQMVVEAISKLSIKKRCQQHRPIVLYFRLGKISKIAMQRSGIFRACHC